MPGGIMTASRIFQFSFAVLLLAAMGCEAVAQEFRAPGTLVSTTVTEHVPAVVVATRGDSVLVLEQGDPQPRAIKVHSGEISQAHRRLQSDLIAGYLFLEYGRFANSVTGKYVSRAYYFDPASHGDRPIPIRLDWNHYSERGTARILSNEEENQSPNVRENACSAEKIEGGYEDFNGECLLTGWNWSSGGTPTGCVTSYCDNTGGGGPGGGGGGGGGGNLVDPGGNNYGEISCYLSAGTAYVDCGVAILQGLVNPLSDVLCVISVVGTYFSCNGFRGTPKPEEKPNNPKKFRYVGEWYVLVGKPGTKISPDRFKNAVLTAAYDSSGTSKIPVVVFLPPR